MADGKYDFELLLGLRFEKGKGTGDRSQESRDKMLDKIRKNSQTEWKMEFEIAGA